MAAFRPSRLDRARGKRIAALRKTLGESQVVFGERFGVEQATVSRWEEGSPPAQRLWNQIAALAGRPVPEFFLDTQQEVPILSWEAASQTPDPGDVSRPPEPKTISAAGLPKGDWFALEVVGDSMDRVAPERSVIFVNRADRLLVHHKFYVFEGTDGTAFRRYAANPPRFEPFSISPRYDTIFFAKRNLRIIGRVWRVSQDL